MTAPATLSLDSSEWRGLLSQNLVRAHEFVQGTASLTAENVAQMHQHLDRMKALVSAWHRSQVPAGAVQQANPQPAAEQPAAAKANGAAPEKRRGGWPLGKPRKKRLGAQALQS